MSSSPTAGPCGVGSRSHAPPHDCLAALTALRPHPAAHRLTFHCRTYPHSRCTAFGITTWTTLPKPHSARRPGRASTSSSELGVRRGKQRSPAAPAAASSSASSSSAAAGTSASVSNGARWRRRSRPRRSRCPSRLAWLALWSISDLPPAGQHRWVIMRELDHEHTRRGDGRVARPPTRRWPRVVWGVEGRLEGCGANLMAAGGFGLERQGGRVDRGVCRHLCAFRCLTRVRRPMTFRRRRARARSPASQREHANLPCECARHPRAGLMEEGW